MSDNYLLDCFPKGFTPRPQQKEVLEAIEEAEKSYDKIILCMPTGSGKSPIAYALGACYGESFILTGTKSLQDQYKESFPHIPVIKGKNNFKCDYLVNYSIPENNSLDKFLDNNINHTPLIKTIQHYREKKLTCDYGPCTADLGNKNKICSYKIDGLCHYYSQRDDGLASNMAILNYALYFTFKTIPFKLPGIYRNTIIYDEAHTLEDQVLKFISFSISKRQLDEINIFYKSNEIKNIDDIIQVLDAIKNRCANMLRDIKLSHQEESVPLKKFYDKCVFLHNEISEDPENFVYEIELDGDFVKKIKLQPINIGKYTKKFFTAPKQFFMSATIDRVNFAKTMGFDYRDMILLEIEESPFELQNRKVVFSNTREISSSKPTFHDDNLAMVREIKNIMNKHSNERGLILTSSKKRCEFIFNNLPRELSSRIIEGHAVNSDKTTINESLEKHTKIPNSVLISSSMWEGVDLKDGLARFSILEKCPYPYLGDKRIEKKSKQDYNWYSYNTLIKILQGMGRCVRNENDYAIVYSLDEKIEKILKRHKSMVPTSYWDMIYLKEKQS